MFTEGLTTSQRNDSLVIVRGNVPSDGAHVSDGPGVSTTPSVPGLLQPASIKNEATVAMTDARILIHPWYRGQAGASGVNFLIRSRRAAQAGHFRDLPIGQHHLHHDPNAIVELLTLKSQRFELHVTLHGIRIGWP